MPQRDPRGTRQSKERVGTRRGAAGTHGAQERELLAGRALGTRGGVCDACAGHGAVWKW